MYKSIRQIEDEERCRSYNARQIASQNVLKCGTVFYVLNKKCSSSLGISLGLTLS